MTVVIREIQLSDAAAFLALGNQLDHETSFMMLEAGERNLNVDAQQLRIMRTIEQAASMIFVAADGDRLVGFLTVDAGQFRRIRHAAYLVIGILQAYKGQGIGTRLFEVAEIWARQHGLHRLELTTMTHNHVAIRLYQKMGFAIEGTRRHAMLVNGAYVDEYYMGKLLD